MPADYSRRHSRAHYPGTLDGLKKGRKGPEGSVARPLRRPLNSLLLPGGFNRVLFG